VIESPRNTWRAPQLAQRKLNAYTTKNVPTNTGSQKAHHGSTALLGNEEAKILVLITSTISIASST